MIYEELLNFFFVVIKYRKQDVQMLTRHLELQVQGAHGAHTVHTRYSNSSAHYRTLAQHARVHQHHRNTSCECDSWVLADMLMLQVRDPRVECATEGLETVEVQLWRVVARRTECA